MAWIQTVKGELVNLDKITSINIVERYGQFVLIAYEPMALDDKDPYAPYDDLIAMTKDRSEAESALDAIKNLVGAKTVAELQNAELQKPASINPSVFNTRRGER